MLTCAAQRRRNRLSAVIEPDGIITSPKKLSSQKTKYRFSML